MPRSDVPLGGDTVFVVRGGVANHMPITMPSNNVSKNPIQTLRCIRCPHTYVCTHSMYAYYSWRYENRLYLQRFRHLFAPTAGATQIWKIPFLRYRS